MGLPGATSCLFATAPIKVRRARAGLRTARVFGCAAAARGGRLNATGQDVAQAATKVAIQGEKGSFSHEAALAMLPGPIALQSCALSGEVFDRVRLGQAACAVIPIENSLAGSVLEHYDLLLAGQLRIHAEYLLRIRHCLIAAPGVQFAELKEVRSHPIALAQCRRFLAEHPQLKAVPYYDTAASVVYAVQAGSGVAGIASDRAALEHGGEVLRASIEDNAANYTRFLLLRPPEAANESAEPPDKVSLAFAVPNQPGSLVGALEVFARHGLNLSRLESRPVPGSPWQYIFYADYQMGPAPLSAADAALTELRQRCRMVQEFGRYRSAAPLLAT